MSVLSLVDQLANRSMAAPVQDVAPTDAQFLIDRLDDFGNQPMSEDNACDWHGHIVPALARFRSALVAAQPAAQPADALDAARYRYLKTGKYSNWAPHISQDRSGYRPDRSKSPYPHYLDVGVDIAVDAAMEIDAARTQGVVAQAATIPTEGS